MTRGLIDKDNRSHWICGPFTARSNDEQYGMRMILEPAALKDMAVRDHGLDVEAMLARLEQARRQSRPLSPAQIGSLEQDLHAVLPEACPNVRLRSAIVQNQLPLNINRTFYSHFGVAQDEPLLDEHRRVFSALLGGRTDEAANALADHLDAARSRSRARLKVLAVVAEPDLPDFLERVH
jgi:DNA-binding GntR family transcriptional regulator